MNPPPEPRPPRRWLLPAAAALGALALGVLVALKPEPERTVPTERVRAVRTIAAPAVAVVPTAVGYGTVRPARTWNGVAEVGGRIVAMADSLKAGATLPAHTELLRIDPTDYELALARAQTDIEAAAAQLAELDVTAANARASLDIERRALDLAENELGRKRRLVGQGTLSRSELDREEANVLAQRQKLQSLANTLNLVPAQRRVLEAQRARAEAQLAQARRDIERTRVRLPFAARIVEVGVEVSQSVAPGQVMVVADGIDRAEVEAQVAIRDMRPLVPATGGRLSEAALFAGPGPLLALEAEVRMAGGPFAWPARVARLASTVDPRTRSIGLILEVDDPYLGAEPGVKPPLFKGLFVEVRLRGQPKPAAVVVPDSALHGEAVHLVGEGGRLEIRPVTVAFTQPGYAVIGGGLAAGEQVVVSDLAPVVAGMRLEPVADAQTLERLLRRAGGAQR